MSIAFTSRWLLRGLVLALALILSSPSALTAEEKEKSSRSKSPARNATDKAPEGAPAELLEYIKKLQNSKAEGSSAAARRESVKRVMSKIIVAAEKIVAAKADDKTTTAAIDAELEALHIQQQLGDEDAGEKLSELAEDLQKDKRQGIAETARYYLLLRDKEQLDESSKDDMRAFAARAQDFLTTVELQPRMAPMAALAVQLIQQIDGPLPAAKVAGDLAIAFAKSKNSEVAANASDFSAYAGRLYEAEQKNDEALTNYEKVAALLDKSNEEELKKRAASLQGAIRNLKLIGSKLQIEGVLVSGKSFDWSKYQGKVVLVDFWATWCGPCIKELPNVKETYEKYHDQGFEVVGISLDDDEQALKDFVEEEQLPWPTLFSKDPKATGWEHPMAAYYGISAIPATILVGRDGKVVARSIYGEELQEKVAELVGADGSDAKRVKKPAKKN